MDDHDYLNKNPDWHADDAPFKAGWIKKIVDGRFSLENKRVADIGCGSGEILVHLKALFPHTYFEGYDISEAAYSIAKKKQDPPHLSFFHADLLECDPTQTKYDLILCIDVFEHIPDYYKFLSELRNHSIKFVFHIPLELSVQTILRSKGLTSYREQYNHLHFFNRVLALQILKDCGYSIIEWQYTPSALVLPGRNLKSFLLRLPRRFVYFLHEDFCSSLLGGFSLMVLCGREKTLHSE